MTLAWADMPLSEVLEPREGKPSLDDLLSGRVRIVSKISFHDGRIEFRAEGATKTGMILVEPGDLLVSGINGYKGAIALYDPAAPGPAAATIHYAAYRVRSDRADPRFLWHVLRSDDFCARLEREVPGGIKTELKPSRLLPVSIALPPLREQRRIVARLEALSGHISEIRDLQRDAKTSIAALWGSLLSRVCRGVSVGGTLSDILLGPPRNGWSARCDNDEDGMPVLALGAVTGFKYRRTEFKKTSLPASAEAHFWLRPGDLLMTRSNTADLVGHAAIYDGSPSPCIYPDLMMRLDVREDTVDRRFVWYWLQTNPVREFVTLHAKGTSPTMKKISQGTVLAIPFPSSLTIGEQHQIVTRLDELMASLDPLQRLRAEAAAKLSALFGTVLSHTLRPTT